MKKDIVFSVLKVALLGTGYVYGVNAAVDVFDTSNVIPITIKQVSGEYAEHPMALLEFMRKSVPPKYIVEVVNSEELFGYSDMFKLDYYSNSEALMEAYNSSSDNVSMLPVGLEAIKLMLRGLIRRYTSEKLDALKSNNIQDMCTVLQEHIDIYSYLLDEQLALVLTCEYLTDCGMNAMLRDREDDVYYAVCRVWENLVALYEQCENDYTQECRNRKIATTPEAAIYAVRNGIYTKVSPKLFKSLDLAVRDSDYIARMYEEEA